MKLLFNATVLFYNAMTRDLIYAFYGYIYTYIYIYKYIYMYICL